MTFKKCGYAERHIVDTKEQLYQVGQCSVTVSHGPIGKHGRHLWHISIEHPNRFPTWAEICEVDQKLRPKGITMGIMFTDADHPGYSDNSNVCHLYEIADVDELGPVQAGDRVYIEALDGENELYECPSCRRTHLSYGQDECPDCHLHMKWYGRTAVVRIL